MTIKEKINYIDDKEALKEILRLVPIESETEEVYQFDEWEMQQVKAGMDDIKNGRTYTQEESDRLISEWLNERSRPQTSNLKPHTSHLTPNAQHLTPNT